MQIGESRKQALHHVQTKRSTMQGKQRVYLNEVKKYNVFGVKMDYEYNIIHDATIKG